MISINFNRNFCQHWYCYSYLFLLYLVVTLINYNNYYDTFILQYLSRVSIANVFVLKKMFILQ